MGIVSASGSKILNRLAKESKDPLERERLRALFVLSLGESVHRVASFFSVDDDTLYRWSERWNSEKDVSDREVSGRPPSLGENEKKEMKRLIDEYHLYPNPLYASIDKAKRLGAIASVSILIAGIGGLEFMFSGFGNNVFSFIMSMGFIFTAVAYSLILYLLSSRT